LADVERDLGFVERDLGFVEREQSRCFCALLR
jgi:hypothetical protein